MSLQTDLAAFEVRLNTAIFDTLSTEVAEAIRDEMSKHLESYTYTRSRGPSGGGVRDKRNFSARVEQSGNITVLRVTDEAHFQSSNQGSISLAKVVETGDIRYKMPQPRPFISPTQEAMDNGEAEAAFSEGMKKRGFVDIESYFHFG